MNDITGKTFGAWTVLRRAESTRRKASQWLCQCACGTTKILHRHNLVAGRTASCGCANKKTLAQRFWAKVSLKEGTTCWLWHGSATKKGYGRLFTGMTSRGTTSVCTASRLAYELVYGPIPDGMQVLHDCDIPACVNPLHLHLGTHQDNMKEAVDRSRMLLNKVKGERHHNAVLTTALARQIKKRAAEGIRPLARELGVSRATVKRVLQGKTWKDA